MTHEATPSVRDGFGDRIHLSPEHVDPVRSTRPRSTDLAAAIASLQALLDQERASFREAS